jgi:hypothetical protein
MVFVERAEGAGRPEGPPRALERAVAWMSRVRREFGGDYDKFLVLSLVALRTGSGGDGYDGPGINVSSIADSAGVPRETARRKVTELLADGLVARDGCNLLRLTPKADILYPELRAGMAAATREVGEA